MYYHISVYHIIEFLKAINHVVHEITHLVESSLLPFSFTRDDRGMGGGGGGGGLHAPL